MVSAFNTTFNEYVQKMPEIQEKHMDMWGKSIGTKVMKQLQQLQMKIPKGILLNL